MRLRTPRQWRRARRALVFLALVGLGLGVTRWPAVGAALFGSALVGLILLETAMLRRSIAEAQRQQHALTQIRPLLGDLPLDLSRWAADPILAHNVVRILTEANPRLVLECGSGSSTVVIARCLRALRRGHVISLEHDPAYARRTEEMLRLYQLEEQATVVTAPLAELDTGGQTFRWYGPQYQTVIKGPIDVLLVDGPPGNSGPRARFPAVPILKSRLAPECWVMLDDGDRPDEREAAHAWSRELGATLSYLEGGKGGWLLHRSPSATALRHAQS